MAEIIDAAVSGDVAAVASIEREMHASSTRPRATPYVVTTEAVLRLLHGLRNGAIKESDAQRWASFIRRGYVAVPGGVPAQSVEIEYDPRHELLIAEVVARLDELGDAIDGILTSEEIAALIASLKTDDAIG